MKWFVSILKWLAVFYVVLCLILYFFQEKLLFFPEKLSSDYRFHFSPQAEEIFIRNSSDQRMHGLLFHAEKPKGLVFYLHGNAGSVAGWGDVAGLYRELGYSVFILDYPGYGKSEGKIRNREALLKDVQLSYNAMKERFSEGEIIIIGYSLGSGLAAYLAAKNSPALLILQAPYYSLSDVMRKVYPIVPRFLLKYDFETARYLRNSKTPVIIFHGDRDEVIYYGSSLKLAQEMKEGDRLITLYGQSHNGITENLDYIREIKKILNNKAHP